MEEFPKPRRELSEAGELEWEMKEMAERHARDVDAQKGLTAWEMEERDKRHADALGIDPLTEVNRREVLERELENLLKMIRGEVHPQRKGNAIPKKLSLIFIDLDRFKQVNDTHGHVTGDAVLKKVASLIKGKIHRSRDLLARYGGDEFAVLLPDTEEAGALAVGEHIRAALESDPELHRFGVTGSIGVCSSEVSTAADTKNFINDADSAAYAAKRAGGNGVKAYRANI